MPWGVLRFDRPNPTLWVTPFPYRPMSIPAPFLLHLVRPILGTSPPHEGPRSARGLRNASDTPFFRAPWLLVAYRSASTAGASPVHAERMLGRRLVPRSLTGLNVIPEVESVTALRIHLTMISCESVSRIRTWTSSPWNLGERESVPMAL
jgi:hypothetical protein